MGNFFDTVLSVLKADERFVAEDGTFLRNAVYEAAMKMDERLIRLLLGNEETRTRFFVEVDDVKVFDKMGFAWLINNRQFWPDSYTRFKNKIGLANENGDLISSLGDVELVFPYKDCILEGGQTKEDQTRKEKYYNATLAPSEIDRLLYPKTLSSAKKIDSTNETPISTITYEDNLLIKGNNLLALSSLNKRYRGMIRLSYWDIPYNTGSDSFGYNDKFSRSTWLTFVKNRVEQVIPLLNSEDGIIMIHCSYHHYAYLKVLLDEIIGNYLLTFNILVRHPERTLTADKEYNDVIEYVLVYSKSPSFKMPKISEVKTTDDYEWVVEELSEGKEVDFDGRKAKVFTPDQYRLKRVTPRKENFKIVTVRGSIKEKNSSGRFYVKYLHPLKKDYPSQTLFKVDDIGDDIYPYRYFYLPPSGNKNGAYLQGMPTSSTHTYKPYPNFLDFVQSYNTVNEEGVVEFRNGKKPEDMIAYFIEMFTNENDIVLDAFAGSGTTAAVALKLNRRFIAIEQMDYIDDITKKRLIGVIDGSEDDVLPDIPHVENGSFIYCELTKLNQSFIEEIDTALDESTLADIYDRIISSGFISYKVNPVDISAAADDYAALSMDDKKKFLKEILDKNLLYVNYCDIDDEEFGISDDDKAFTRSFYGEG